ncbi:MAG: HAD family hydrolase [Gammaproteobacteria bacterium]
MNNGLKALLFDVDGTLADTERDGHRVAFNAAFDEYGTGWHWDVDLYGTLLAVTGGKERIRFYASAFLNNENLPANFEQLVPELHAAKTRHYTQLLSTGAIPLRPGIERLLKEARKANLRLAIATTTTPDNVTALLKHTLGSASLGWFDVIAAGDIVPAKKPASDIYDYALSEMKLAPYECLAFEDSHNGILSSMGAGIPTIITVNDYTREHDFSQALLVLDTLGEPDQPFTAMQGKAHNHTYVDCALLKMLHGQ